MKPMPTIVTQSRLEERDSKCETNTSIIPSNVLPQLDLFTIELTILIHAHIAHNPTVPLQTILEWLLVPLAA